MDNRKELEQIYKLIEGLYTHTTAQFTELRTEVTKNGEAIERLEHKVAKNGEAIERLEHKVAKNGEAIERLEHQVAKNGEAIERLEHRAKKTNKTLLNHDLDIQLLKRAVI